MLWQKKTISHKHDGHGQNFVVGKDPLFTALSSVSSGLFRNSASCVLGVGYLAVVDRWVGGGSTKPNIGAWCLPAQPQNPQTDVGTRFKIARMPPGNGLNFFDQTYLQKYFEYRSPLLRIY